MKIHHVNNAEDYKDWQADKLLHEAYKTKAEVQKTHSWQALVRKWIDHQAGDGKN